MLDGVEAMSNGSKRLGILGSLPRAKYPTMKSCSFKIAVKFHIDKHWLL